MSNSAHWKNYLCHFSSTSQRQMGTSRLRSCCWRGALSWTGEIQMDGSPFMLRHAGVRYRKQNRKQEADKGFWKHSHNFAAAIVSDACGRAVGVSWSQSQCQDLPRGNPHWYIYNNLMDTLGGGMGGRGEKTNVFNSTGSHFQLVLKADLNLDCI